MIQINSKLKIILENKSDFLMNLIKEAIKTIIEKRIKGPINDTIANPLFLPIGSKEIKYNINIKQDGISANILNLIMFNLKENKTKETVKIIGKII